MATEIINIEQNNNSGKEALKSCCSCNCSCNTRQHPKEYIQRAKRNYRLRKIEADPNYKETERKKVQEYIEKNKEQYKEGRKLYMREYRARKKKEEATNNVTQITDGINAIDIAVAKTE